MKAIGIDLGTTTISGVVYHIPTGTVEYRRTIPSGTFLPGDSWERIQDIGEIISGGVSLLDSLLDQFPETASIGLTGQMHGILYVDKRGKAVSDLYTWQDKSGDAPVFDGDSLCQIIKEKYGITACAGYGFVTHMFHHKRNLVPEQAVSICTAADYLGMVLTGRRAPLLHISQAASLGFYDGRNNCFMRSLVEQLGIDVSILPEITAAPACLGSYRGIPVSVSLGDNQASFLGSVDEPERAVLLNIGTGSQISVYSSSFFEALGIEARPLTADRWLLVGAALCGGRSYALLEQFFREYAVMAGLPDDSQYDVMRRFLDMDSEPLPVTTTFAGTRTNPSLRGSIAGISTENFRPGPLITGVVTGMANELHDMYGIIQNGTGIFRDKLIASGNGVRKNPALQRILSRKFGMPLTMVANEEEAACGAAKFSAQLLE